jgi:hypothetical protein
MEVSMINENNVDLNLSYNVKEITLNTARFLTGLSFYFGLYLVCFTKLNFFVGLSFSFLPLITLPLISYYQNKALVVKLKEDKAPQKSTHYEYDSHDFVLK